MFENKSNLSDNKTSINAEFDDEDDTTRLLGDTNVNILGLNILFIIILVFNFFLSKL